MRSRRRYECSPPSASGVGSAATAVLGSSNICAAKFPAQQPTSARQTKRTLRQDLAAQLAASKTKAAGEEQGKNSKPSRTLRQDLAAQRGLGDVDQVAPEGLQKRRRAAVVIHRAAHGSLAQQAQLARAGRMHSSSTQPHSWAEMEVNAHLRVILVVCCNGHQPLPRRLCRLAEACDRGKAIGWEQWLRTGGALSCGMALHAASIRVLTGACCAPQASKYLQQQCRHAPGVSCLHAQAIGWHRQPQHVWSSSTCSSSCSSNKQQEQRSSRSNAAAPLLPATRRQTALRLDN